MVKKTSSAIISVCVCNENERAMWKIEYKIVPTIENGQPFFGDSAIIVVETVKIEVTAVTELNAS